MPIARRSDDDFRVEWNADFDKMKLTLSADFISPALLSNFLLFIHRHDGRFEKAGIIGTVDICEHFDVRLKLPSGVTLKMCAYQTYIRRFPDLELFEIDAKKREVSRMPHSVTLDHSTHYCPKDYRIEWDADLDKKILSMRADFISTTPLAEFLDVIHRHDERFRHLRRFGIEGLCKRFDVHLELPSGATFIVRTDPSIRRYPDIAFFEIEEKHMPELSNSLLDNCLCDKEI
jgi:hypothetical protein